MKAIEIMKSLVLCWGEWKPLVNNEISGAITVRLRTFSKPRIMKSLVLLPSGWGEWEPNSYIMFSVGNTHTQVPGAISYKTGGHFSAGGCSFMRLRNLPTTEQNHITQGTGSGDLHVITSLLVRAWVVRAVATGRVGRVSTWPLFGNSHISVNIQSQRSRIQWCTKQTARGHSWQSKR